MIQTVKAYSKHTHQRTYAMNTPLWTADEDARKAREAAICAKLSRISKQHKVTQDSKALQLLANYAVDEVQQQKTELETRRRARSPFAKTGNALQKFMSILSQFMKAYSGLNDVAKGADSQYGALVTGALSVLLQVSVPLHIV